MHARPATDLKTYLGIDQYEEYFKGVTDANGDCAFTMDENLQSIEYCWACLASASGNYSCIIRPLSNGVVTVHAFDTSGNPAPADIMVSLWIIGTFNFSHE